MRYRSAVLRRMLVLAGMVGISLSCAAHSEAAQEERCKQLGGNCICSNKLDATGWSTGAGTNWAMDAVAALDSTDKPCMTGGSPTRHRLVMTSQKPPTVTSGLKGLRALQDNSTGSYVTAVQLSPSQHDATSSGITAGRYYFTLNGTNWTSTYEGACTNDKYIQIGGPYMTTGSGGVWADNLGGGLSGSGVHDCQNGKWCRIEMQRNRSTGTATFWVKNITDNTPERSWTRNNGGTGLGEFTDPLHKFREPDGGCTGTAKYMFVMTAHWPNPVGSERIGAAPELEGGGSSNTTPPPAPTGLTVQ